MIVILDFDGTLTAEEQQAQPLAQRSLDTLAHEIIGASRAQLERDYVETRERLLGSPAEYWWEVNGLIASYCDEGAFILNTTTLQTMLRDTPRYAAAVADRFPAAEYDPVVDCTNHLFHRHTAELPTCFRPEARELLLTLLDHPAIQPLVLTNSLGDKVARHLEALQLPRPIEILGDTRQYDMQPAWSPPPNGLAIDGFPRWRVDPLRHIDLRRPAYYAALMRMRKEDDQIVVVADTLSLPGALALRMGIRFYLLATPYTPDWCRRVVADHPLGAVLSSLNTLPASLDL